jgi:hypothetical protein
MKFIKDFIQKIKDKRTVNQIINQLNATYMGIDLALFYGADSTNQELEEAIGRYYKALEWLAKFDKEHAHHYERGLDRLLEKYNYNVEG